MQQKIEIPPWRKVIKSSINYFSWLGVFAWKNAFWLLIVYKLDCYKGKDCMERFCEDLREHAMKIINYEKKRNDTTNW